MTCAITGIALLRYHDGETQWAAADLHQFGDAFCVVPNVLLLPGGRDPVIHWRPGSSPVYTRTIEVVGNALERRGVIVGMRDDFVLNSEAETYLERNR